MPTDQQLEATLALTAIILLIFLAWHGGMIRGTAPKIAAAIVICVVLAVKIYLWARMFGIA